ncbi:SDR family oxidoreductase [Lactobacillus kefiranofaciens]|uniref:SDR family oxidoreductase n=3 Tax=Lactobacillus kefiranofaciens TaxID=267818 RepID=UPI002ACD6C71|nr:SDR family oxidoreductase [Lactobacillus kefiranofaciens]WQH37064.1 SDR family oxidoreductase [Lactobacillus kefiranofaciens]
MIHPYTNYFTVSSPGFVKTAMSEKYYTTFKNKVPFKRFASPTEVADLVLFLTSSMADYITGENFIIDGGFSNL